MNIDLNENSDFSREKSLSVKDRIRLANERA